MYHTKKNPLKSLLANESLEVPAGQNIRTLHKALLRYHDPKNWSLIRDCLLQLERGDLIGNHAEALISSHQPRTRTFSKEPHKPQRKARTQHARSEAHDRNRGKKSQKKR